MIAVDTNIVVRFLTRDDPVQAPRAKALMDGSSVFILRTVILETEWVLRTVYRLDRTTIATGIAKLLGLPGVVIEDSAAVRQALGWYAQRLDFANALHLASSGQTDAFATFDRALRRKARSLAGAIPVVVP